jgi:hypothetical protein
MQNVPLQRQHQVSVNQHEKTSRLVAIDGEWANDTE